MPTADQRSTNGANHQLTDRFRQLLERHFLEYQTVQACAQTLGVTANHLSESVKATTGLPAGTMMRQRSILEAKRLLVYTDRSVQQIANLLNFPDPAYFGRFFKRETAQSPLAFGQKLILAIRSLIEISDIKRYPTSPNRGLRPLFQIQQTTPLN